MAGLELSIWTLTLFKFLLYFCLIRLLFFFLLDLELEELRWALGSRVSFIFKMVLVDQMERSLPCTPILQLEPL